MVQSETIDWINLTYFNKASAILDVIGTGLDRIGKCDWTENDSKKIV